MADDIDRATARTAQELELSLQHRPLYVGESAHDCTECGAEIPELRRTLLPGIQVCVDCAAAQEVHHRRFKRH